MDNQLEILIEANGYIKKLYQGTQSSIEYLRKGETKKGYDLITHITEGLGWLGDALRCTQGIQKEVIDTIELNTLLSAMIEAMENTDRKLLADVMEFELLDQLQRWEITTENNIESYRQE